MMCEGCSDTTCGALLSKAPHNTQQAPSKQLQVWQPSISHSATRFTIINHHQGPVTWFQNVGPQAPHTHTCQPAGRGRHT